MMQTTKAGQGSHVCSCGRLRLDWPFVRGVLFERVVNTVLMVVAHVITHEPEQMSFVQRDDMVQDLTATTSNPSFRGSILPGRLDARPLRFQAGRLQKGRDGGIKYRIAIQDHVMVWASFGEGLPQLLHDPLRRRMASDVEVKDPAAPMLDHKEAVQQVERQRWHSKEVEGNNGLPVILKKRQPPFTRVASALNSTQIPGDGPLRDTEAELRHLAMDFGRSPTRVLFCQSSNQLPDFRGHLGPTAAGPGSPTPV